MTSVSQTIDEFDHTLKLIRADIQRNISGKGGNPDYNEQWVEVLLLEEPIYRGIGSSIVTMRPGRTRHLTYFTHLRRLQFIPREPS